MSTAIVLTDDLESFAVACVESGAFGSIDEVVGASLRLLKIAEEQRGTLRHLLEEAEAEADRVGDVSLEDTLKEIDAIIAKHER